MKTLKISLATVCAILIGFVAMSFKVSESARSTLHWFEVENGVLADYIGTDLGSGDCSPIINDKVCAHAYTEEQTIPSGSGRALHPNTDPDEWQDRGFTEDD